MNPHTLLITISSEEVDVDSVEQKLDGAKDWLRYSPGCWLVYTKQTANTWYSRLSEVATLDRTQIFICEVNLEDRAGRLSPTAWSWIKKVRQQNELVAS